jgi:hypothetical protein
MQEAATTSGNNKNETKPETKAPMTKPNFLRAKSF